MNVKELIEVLKNIKSEDIKVEILIERGRGLSISNEVDFDYDEEENVLSFSGEETSYD